MLQNTPVWPEITVLAPLSLKAAISSCTKYGEATVVHLVRNGPDDVSNEQLLLLCMPKFLTHDASVAF